MSFPLLFFVIPAKAGIQEKGAGCPTKNPDYELRGQASGMTDKFDLRTGTKQLKIKDKGGSNE